MRTSTLTRRTLAILIGAAIAPVGPAAAQGESPASDRADSQVIGTHADQVVLRRDGERAVPFDPQVGIRDELVLRRDGSSAVPFVPYLSPPSGGTQSDGFDWGDAAIGAAAAVGVMLLASTARTAVHRRRRSTMRPAGAV